MTSSSAITSSASSMSWCSTASIGAVELADDQVEALERAVLEPLELLLVVDADAVGHQPTFPVT